MVKRAAWCYHDASILGLITATIAGGSLSPMLTAPLILIPLLAVEPLEDALRR